MSLVLPKPNRLWLPDWRPLQFAHLKKTSGHLTKLVDGTHLAKCGDECVCDIPLTYSTCQCFSANYGSATAAPDVTVTISGSMTPRDLSILGCGSPAGCASIAGSYVIACGTTPQWCHSEFVCNAESPPGVFQDYYYVSRASFEYQNVSNTLQVKLTLWSQVVGTATGAGNPYPTLSTSCPGSVSGGKRITTWRSGAVDQWFFQPGGSCTASCNFVTTAPRCPTTANLSLFSDTLSNGPNGCDADTLTLSIAV